MTKTLFVFAEIKPKPEHRNEVRDAILGVLDQTRSEDGCRSFDLFEGTNPGDICLFEEWDDQAALDAHYAQPYIAEVFAAYEEWLATPPEVKKLARIG